MKTGPMAVLFVVLCQVLSTVCEACKTSIEYLLKEFSTTRKAWENIVSEVKIRFKTIRKKEAKQLFAHIVGSYIRITKKMNLNEILELREFSKVVKQKVNINQTLFSLVC